MPRGSRSPGADLDFLELLERSIMEDCARRARQRVLDSL